MTIVMKQSRLILAMLLLFVMQLSGACVINPFAVEGSGKQISEDRQVSAFKAIDISGGFEVELIQSEAESLTIEADDNLMKLIKTEVMNGELKISLSEPVRNVKKLKAIITFRQLEVIDISGAVRIKGINAMNFEKLSIDASGASEINLNLMANSLEMDLSGASKTSLNGKVDMVRADCSGASKFYAGDLETSSFSFEASGASFAELWVKDRLSVDASGASKVRYKGQPANIEKNTSGASSVKEM